MPPPDSESANLAGIHLRVTLGGPRTIKLLSYPAPPLRTSPETVEIDLPGAGTYEVSIEDPQLPVRPSSSGGHVKSSSHGTNVHEDTFVGSSSPSNVLGNSNPTEDPPDLDLSRRQTHANGGITPSPQSAVLQIAETPIGSQTSSTTVDSAHGKSSSSRKRPHHQERSGREREDVESPRKRQRTDHDGSASSSKDASR